MAITRTYHVIDGGENPAPNLKPRSRAKEGVVSVAVLSVLSAVIGIATSRWGGVSKQDHEAAMTTQKRELTEIINTVLVKVNAVDGKVDKLGATVGGINTLLQQQAEKAKGRRGR